MQRLGLMTAALVVAAACGGDESVESDIEPVNEQATVDSATADTADMGGPAALGVATMQEGGRSYITDAQGRALYLFTADTQGEGTSACEAECIQRWPPLLVTPGAEVSTPAGLQADLVSTFQRADGAHQVAYNGWPLYYFTEDAMGGTASGQDVHDSGGEWYLVTPEGTKLEEQGGDS